MHVEALIDEKEAKSGIPHHFFLVSYKFAIYNLISNALFGYNYIRRNEIRKEALIFF